MSNLFERFSSKENLKKAYEYVKKELTNSSLSVNPLNHPSITAIDDIGDQFFSILESYLRNDEYKPEKGFFVYLPKDNLGLRPVCVISMVDRIIYQAMFNPDILGLKIDGQLSEKVCFANRVNEDVKIQYFFNKYTKGWNKFCVEQKTTFEKGFMWKLEVDVQQYYEHIPIEKLINKLRNDFNITDEKLLSLLKTQLCTWVEYNELLKGIPQGPNTSAVLANIYLASLDKYAEDDLINKDLRYFRYADDFVLMGKSKDVVLKAVEKIVHFLREQNLNLNEKTRIERLEDTKMIDEKMIFSEYDEDTEEIPLDDLTRIAKMVPKIVSAIANGKSVEKIDLRRLKYFLKVSKGHNINLILKLIKILPLRPSLTIPIIQYTTEGRNMYKVFEDSDETNLIDNTLWEIYKNDETSSWSKFWILKLLLSNKDVAVKGIDKEVKSVLNSKNSTTIFKIVCLYHQIIKNDDINLDQLKQLISECKTDIEKSIYSFFSLNAFQTLRVPVVKNFIERLLNQNSHELNLIGCYLYKNKPEVKIDDIDGKFSKYILKPEETRKSKKGIKTQNEKFKKGSYGLVRIENIISIDSPAEMFGVKNIRKNKNTVDLIFPEVVKWDNVVLKIKEGLQDIEIWYKNRHIKTTNYVELGFSSNKKEHKPDRRWNFLTILSVLQNEDIKQATPDNLMTMIAKYSGHTTKRANVHQTKRLLSKALRDIFKTDENPFIDNKKYYEPKFKILPEAMMRNKKLWKQGGHLNENIDYGDAEEE